jgi:hypothetical protein
MGRKHRAPPNVPKTSLDRAAGYDEARLRARARAAGRPGTQITLSIALVFAKATP